MIFEDDDLLVVSKPAGMNTHAPSPFAGEGIYEWLRHREPRWASLAILHRLDKETSGVLVFGKTSRANKSLTEQFTGHRIRKKYLLVTDRAVKRGAFTITSSLARAGEKYVSRPEGMGGERAETRFCVSTDLTAPFPGATVVVAEPVTGRTHQIRVHAAGAGFPVLGDVLYGGTPAARVFLHSAELTLEHPATGREMTFESPPAFEAEARMNLRRAFVEPDATDAYRLIHGAADGWAGWYVDRLGGFLLSQAERELNGAQRTELERLLNLTCAKGAYHKILNRRVREAATLEVSPQHVLGEAATGPFVIRENGVQFELSFAEGYSVGLFLDQRDNRRRLLTGQVAAKFPLAESDGPAEVLNVFAYTCGFSVCAARAGARVVSLDLSKKYLEWGRRNFALNGLDPAGHDFIYGDAFEWLNRLTRKKRAFDVIILDPPTFSQSKAGGAFRAEKDFGRLVSAALPLLKANGVILASTNAARLEPESFLEVITAAVHSTGRKITQQHYVPQPPDFPVSREEPGYLKTVWVRVSDG